MSPTIGLIVTTVVVLVLFHLLDWLFWGTSWTQRHVFAHVPKEMFRLPDDPAKQKEAGKRAVLLGALVTTFAAVVFVPLVWLLGPRFAGARVLVLAVLLAAAFVLPGALYEGIYYRVPKQMVWLHWWAGFARVVVGLVATTWLLTTFNAW